MNLLAVASVAEAQPVEAVGVRALGMGGAFTAVADDATATYWNPAGLAGGAYFNALIEYVHGVQPGDGGLRAPGRPSQRLVAGGIALSFPALGLSYYPLHVSQIAHGPSTGSSAPDREAERAGGVRLVNLSLNQFGVTVGRSVGDYLVIGTTLKLMHGSAAVAPALREEETSLDQAASLDGVTSSRFDLDVGAMVTLGLVRIGATLRNATAPTFDAGAAEYLTLDRRVRAGIAVRPQLAGPVSELVAAVDADLTTTAGASGDEREVGAGVEAWALGHRVGVRAGVRANTAQAGWTAGSAGASVGLGRGWFVDAQVTHGGARAPRSWGVGARMTF